MKKLLIVSLTFFFAIKSNAQINETTLLGSVADTKNTPIESATITLMKSKDSSIIKIAVSDKIGKFSFSGIPFGSYFISISAVSFTKANSPVFVVGENNTSVTLETVVLQELPKNLSVVTVTAKKPLIEQKIDRMIVNVDASVTNVGATALEVLEKSPGVSVDKDGNISLKGKPKVMIMIDGKPSYLGGAELANLLTNMNANQLSQIEIMTNPSAKYDAAGNAGVINIKTKKSLTQGFNGSVTLNYGQGVYPKTNNSIMLNYRVGKINTFLNYSYALNRGFMNVDVQRNFLDSAGKKSYAIEQVTNNFNKSQNNNLKFGLDYFINPSTTFGFVASGFVAPQKGNGFTTATIKDINDNVSSVQKTTRSTANTWKNGSLNLNFHTSLDSNKKELTGNFDYLHYDFSGKQDVFGITYNSSNQLLSTSFLKNILPLKINVYSARIDYAQSLANDLKLEMGFKSSAVNTTNSARYYSGSTSSLKLEDSLSSNFNYRENINAAYINLNKSIGNWTVQAGLRAENTNYNGHETANNNKQDSAFSRSYVSLFPTAFVSYHVNENNQLGLSVGRRIDRPAYQQLNPFIAYIDKYMQMAGNPYLKPQFSNTIELSHTYKNIFTTTINYSVIHAMMNETLTQKDSIVIRSVGNIGTRYNYGISESATLKFTKWYTSTIFANLYENKYAGMINGLPLNAKQLTLEMNINNQFSFNKGWSAEVSGVYASRNRDEGQALSLPIGQVSAGISKQLFNNKASLKFNVRDIFYTQTIREIQNFQNVQSTINRSMDTRVFNIAFVYRFGKQVKSKAIAPTEEQKRIQAN